MKYESQKYTPSQSLSKDIINDGVYSLICIAYVKHHLSFYRLSHRFLSLSHFCSKKKSALKNLKMTFFFEFKKYQKINYQNYIFLIYHILICNVWSPSINVKHNQATSTVASPKYIRCQFHQR